MRTFERNLLKNSKEKYFLKFLEVNQILEDLFFHTDIEILLEDLTFSLLGNLKSSLA